ncbi:helix-turn-helix domain-containing protein [Alicyclobacillus fastidiosus]|uniref:Helix-turn-helix transcriptional regulator n=1 Tax=Alicyclobacillus fastidiosus TaxID=392011 RepID=A0ABV5A9T4_9BACL|nr:helix-turn-helix transcriptional regulator [Alicyclobacillus fastidiosus]WEH10950.1 helix-turn-helix transcriptional regulator [Alicyclobacillus fastidiosus]
MPIPHALKISRTSRGMRQGDVPVPYSQQMVSAIEQGKREIAPDMAPRFAEALDHPAMYMELARELTGGYGPAWLDGPNVDTHRASIRERCLEEMEEAMDFIRKSPASTLPSVETDADHKRRYEHLLQCFDAIVALHNYVGSQCIEYGFSMMRLSQDHYNKLKSRRYVQAN